MGSTPELRHAADVGLHALPLGAAGGQEVAGVVEVLDAAAALELRPRVPPRLLPRPRVRDPPRPPQDLPVQR